MAVKGLIGKCGCTRMVQGGYNVALGGGDTVERHFMDTINGGKWLPDQDMAWRLCSTAVERIHELEMKSAASSTEIPTARCIRRPLPDRPQTGQSIRAI